MEDVDSGSSLSSVSVSLIVTAPVMSQEPSYAPVVFFSRVFVRVDIDVATVQSVDDRVPFSVRQCPEEGE
jgi:hypothetical protein